MDEQIAFNKCRNEWVQLQKQESRKQVTFVSCLMKTETEESNPVSVFYKTYFQKELDHSKLVRSLIKKSVKRINNGYILGPEQKILVLMAPAPYILKEEDYKNSLKEFPGTYVVRLLGDKMRKYDHYGWSIITKPENEPLCLLQWFPEDKRVKPVFDDGNQQQLFEVQDELEFTIGSDQDLVVHKEEKTDNHSISNIIPKIIKRDLSNDLLTIPARFYKLSFQLHPTITGPMDQAQIDKIFLDHQKHSIEEVIVKFLDERNLSNASLGDVVYIYQYLKSNDHFRFVRAVKNRQEMKTDDTTLRTQNNLMSLPANFLDYKWYYSRPEKERNTNHDELNSMLGEIGENLQGVTTEDLANELCFYLDDEQDCLKEPNLLFDAQLFRILEKDSRFRKVEVDEKIMIPEFETVQSTTVSRPKVTIVKKRVVQKKTIQKPLSRPIEDLGFSVRTYNCLKRNKITTVEKLKKMSCDEIRNLHHMNKKMFNEIMDKMRVLGS